MRKEHHHRVREQAANSLVLLKNANERLPLSPQQRVAVIGEMAVKPRFRLEGSALVNPTMQDIPLDCLSEYSNQEILFEQGWGDKGDISRAQSLAEQADVVVIFAGLTQGMEAEGHDRKTLSLSEEQDVLIKEISKVQDHIIVVLSGGGPIEMPWIEQVDAVLMCFLAGQAMGGAVADILYGKADPGGRLPITFPRMLCQVPDYLTYPGDKEKVEYREGIFTGYRYYEKTGLAPLFPFGHGLSYTTFQYMDIHVDTVDFATQGVIRLSLSVSNTGNSSGKEVVQLYVGAIEKSIRRPVKELKGFRKLYLEPGQESTVVFELYWKDFAYYHPELKDWYVESGEYELMAGHSVSDIRQCIKLRIDSEPQLAAKLSGWSPIERFKETVAGRRALAEMKKISEEAYCEKAMVEMLRNNRFDDVRIRFLTLQSQTVFDNDRIEQYISKCNQEYRDSYREDKKKQGLTFKACVIDQEFAIVTESSRRT